MSGAVWSNLGQSSTAALSTVGVEPLLRVSGLRIDFASAAGVATTVVDIASLRLDRGRILGLVGESGSGKTMLARAVLRLMPPGARVLDGRMELEGVDLVGLSTVQMRGIRGRRIGMVFQEPMASLNPAMRVGEQMAEAMRLHTSLGKREIRHACIEMLRRVRVTEPERCLDRYPHEFSGGLRQRLMLASVMLPKPALLLADEPTTALDCIVQKEVLEIMVEVTRELGTSVLLITHDLTLVAEYADEMAVMDRGKVVESGAVRDILRSPHHARTIALLEALPKRKAGTPDAPERETLVEARNVNVEYKDRQRWLRRSRTVTHAVNDVTLSIRKSETLALVGESGSGKTTLGRSLLRLVQIAGGSVAYRGQDISRLQGAALREWRRKVQLIFQDPYSSLDPRMRVSDIVGEALRHETALPSSARAQRVLEALREVDLPESFAVRFPHELSGGQRQRVCIARAVVMRPEFVVADEPVAALDATVRAQVLELLDSLKVRFGFTCLLVSHDLGVVERFADRVAVMYAGKLVEIGPTAEVFARPHHPYTRQLLDVRPKLAAVECAGYQLQKRVLPECVPPKGWHFAQALGQWATRQPRELMELGAGHFVLCTAHPERSRRPASEPTQT